MRKIAIILLNYNSSVDCRKCVGFLQAQQGIELEIVIVDNCSRVEDRAAVVQLCDECGATFLPVSENKGYNAGNNVGLRYAAEKGYQYALIANPDMEFPQSDYLSRLVVTADGQKGAVVFGSDIVTPDGRHQNPQREVSYCEEVFWFLTFIRNRYSKQWYLENYEESGLCSKLAGCCFLINLDFFKKIGGFDENVFLYCEESILAKQVISNGCSMYYAADLKAIHRHIASQKSPSRGRMNILFASRCYFTKNYSGYYGWKLWILLFSSMLQRFAYRTYYFFKGR